MTRNGPQKQDFMKVWGMKLSLLMLIKEITEIIPQSKDVHPDFTSQV